MQLLPWWRLPVSQNLRLYIVLIGAANGTGLFGVPVSVRHFHLRGTSYPPEVGEALHSCLYTSQADQSIRRLKWLEQMSGILVIYRNWNIWLAIFVLVVYRRGSKGGSSSSSGGGLFATRSLETTYWVGCTRSTSLDTQLRTILAAYLIDEVIYLLLEHEKVWCSFDRVHGPHYCHLIISARDNCLKASPLLQAF